jgi:hypothetical protein
VPNSHAGKAIAANVLAVIDNYDLRNKVGFFILDNASRNDTAVEILGETLQLIPRSDSCVVLVIYLTLLPSSSCQ